MRVHLRKLMEIHKNMQNTNLCRVRIEFCTLLYDLPSKLKSKMFVSFYVVLAKEATYCGLALPQET